MTTVAEDMEAASRRLFAAFAAETTAEAAAGTGPFSEYARARIAQDAKKEGERAIQEVARRNMERDRYRADEPARLALAGQKAAAHDEAVWRNGREHGILLTLSVIVGGAVVVWVGGMVVGLLRIALS